MLNGKTMRKILVHENQLMKDFNEKSEFSISFLKNSAYLLLAIVKFRQNSCYS